MIWDISLFVRSGIVETVADAAVIIGIVVVAAGKSADVAIHKKVVIAVVDSIGT